MSSTTTDKNSSFELLVGYILLSGVVLSGALIAAGIGWRWHNTGRPELGYSISGMNLFQFWRTDIAEALLGHFRPRLLVNSGIAVLMLTPFVRVAASMVYFMVAERNTKYSFFTGFVLLLLGYSLFLH